MDDLASALHDAGGAHAPRERAGQLRTLLAAELAHGRGELALARSGRERPVVVAFAADGGNLLAVTPAPAALRADPEVADERTWLLVAAAVGALAELAPGTLLAGELGGSLVLAMPGTVSDEDAELAALGFEEQVAGVDRLRATALALPGHVVEGSVAELREPIGATHPLRVAAAVARLGRQAGRSRVERRARGGGARDADRRERPAVARPHDDPIRAPRRPPRAAAARRDGQVGRVPHGVRAPRARLRGNDRALAETVASRSCRRACSWEKPSVGQRHVFLNSRRAGDIPVLIDDGVVPSDLRLP